MENVLVVSDSGQKRSQQTTSPLISLLTDKKRCNPSREGRHVYLCVDVATLSWVYFPTAMFLFVKP